MTKSIASFGKSWLAWSFWKTALTAPKPHMTASLEAPSPLRLPTRDRPHRHTQLPSCYSDAVVQLPQPQQQFNESALPEHIRSEYTDVMEQLRDHISGR